MAITYALFVAGFVLLLKGADLLVDGASSIAKRLHIPLIVIGLTIVAFGTSAPELAVSLFASIQGNTEIAIGNIVGSNIVNILLILGIAAVIYPLAVQRSTIWKEIPLSLLAATLIFVLVNDVFVDHGTMNMLTRGDGLVLLSFFIIFMYYTVGLTRAHDEEAVVSVREFSLRASIGMVLAGLAGLVLGGKWIVDGAVAIATAFGASEALIGLTIVAIGTSLPELATSVVAAYKKNSDIAVGNIVGSNIVNIFFVLGVSAVVRPLPFLAARNVDIGMAIVASVFLFLALFVGKRRVLERWQGIGFIATYAAYLAFLIVRG